MNARAIGYVRVSKAREEMISPELQITAITDYCQRNGAALVAIITDLDTTGRNFARAGIQQAIGQVESGEANLVVVWKWSRFGRNVRDCLINIDRLEVAGGRLVAATEDFDDTPVGRFGRGQFLLMAQFESERIGEQWKEAQARRIRNGLPHHGLPRFGYTYSKADGYQPDPLTAPILISLYERYIAGESPRRISDDLNRQGIPSPGGGTWWNTTIQQTLSTGFGAGLIRVNPRPGGASPANGTYLPGKHQAVISTETWEAYCRKRAINAGLAPQIREPKHSLSGLVRCGGCGGSLYKTVSTKRPTALLCSSRAQKRTCPHPVYVQLAYVEEKVMEWLVAIAEEVDTRTRATQEARAGKSRQRGEAKAHAREIVRLDNALTRLTRQFAEGLIPDSAYLTARDSLTSEKKSHEDALLRLQDAVASMATPKAAPALIRDWPTLDTLGRREILAALISQVTVTGHGAGYRATVDITPKWESR